MKKLFLTSLALLLCALSLSAQNVGEAFYVYRNDGQFNAFFRSEVDSIVYSYEDAAGNRYDDIVTQLVYTADSLYQIPLSAIDSVAFVAPSTVYKEDVVQLTGDLFDYVISVEGQVIRLSPDVPKKLLPAVGDKIGTAELTDKIPYGFSGEVKTVSTSSDGSILVSCEEIPIEEVVDRLFAVFETISESDEVAAVRPKITWPSGQKTFRIPLPSSIPISSDLAAIIKKKKIFDFSGSAKAEITLNPSLVVTTSFVISPLVGFYVKNVANLSMVSTEEIDIVGQVSTSTNNANKFKKLHFSKDYPLAYGLTVYVDAGVKADGTGEIGLGGTFTQLTQSSLTIDFSSLFLRPDLRTASFNTKAVDKSANWKHVVGRASVKVGPYVQVGFGLLSHKVAKVGVEFDGGLKVDAEAAIDIEALGQADRTTTFYDALVASGKVDVSPYVGVAFVSSVLDDRFSFRAGHDWELGPRWLQLRLLPSFSNVKAERNNGVATAGSSITNDLVLPLKVGFTAIGDDGSCLAPVYKEDGLYWNRSSFSSYNVQLNGVGSDTSYKVYPTIQFFGHTLLASPSAELKKNSLCPDANHPHAIDMGAAGKWACCNVGASNPFEYGGYYAWGETEEKSDYSSSTYHVTVKTDISGNPQYDVAAKKWGGAWKMPTSDRIDALLDCSNEWTTVGGVNGRLFTASNGNRLFLPAAGCRGTGGLNGAGGAGRYWSSTPFTSYSYGAYCLGFDSSGAFWGGGDRSLGLSVRPVAE